jgi:hypothetical protein
MRTYATIHQDPKADIDRANAVAIISIVAGLAVLFLFAIIAYVIGDMSPVFVGAAISVLSMSFGVWASWYHTSKPMRANLEQAEREANHQRAIELERAKAETKVLVLDADARRQLAGRVPDSAFTRPLRNDRGTVIFPAQATEIAPSAPSAPATDVVEVAGWGSVRVDLLEAIAAQWPQTSRQRLRESGMTFENDEYKRALGAMTDTLAGETEPTRYDVRVALLRIKHGAPSPARLEVVQN